MKSTHVERGLLGALILRPGLLEDSDLRDFDFPAGRLREVFSALATIWEESRPAEIDPVILAERIGGNGAGEFIGGLLDGGITLDPGTFRGRVSEARKRALTTRILGTIERQAKGGELDLDEVQGDLEAYRALSEPGVDAPPGLMRLMAVDPVPVDWIWRNYLPIGQGSLISGDPGDGKTWIGLDLAARLSLGAGWPDGSAGDAPANSIYLSLEDNAADTLRPRLDSLGGDPDRVFILSMKRPELLNLSMGAGLKALEHEAAVIGNVRLVVVDPILDFSGRVKANAAEEVRAFLEPLIEMARRQRFALVIISHLNKDASMKAMYRTMGTTSGWLGRCRAGFYLFRDPDDRNTRILHCQKANLAPQEPPQIAFTIEDGRVVYRDPGQQIDPDADLGATPGQGREFSAAAEWLKTVLSDGPVDVKDLMRMGKEEGGFSQAALYRAKDKLGIKPTLHGFGRFKTSQWELPGRTS